MSQGSPSRVASAPENTPEGLAALRRDNQHARTRPWPAPYDRTEHRLHRGDARDLAWIPDESVHLIVTSPPYWTLKEYEHSEGQLADIPDYEAFLAELDRVWAEDRCVLVPGGRIGCVVGAVCLPRRRGGAATASCRCTPTSRSGRGGSVWIA
jgi:site-specific DNA-methyltransferase (adenine-specific)